MGTLSFAPIEPEDTSTDINSNAKLKFSPIENKNLDINKLNLFQDSVFDMQEKLELDKTPYVSEEEYEKANKGVQLGTAAKYGFNSSVQGAVYHASAVPGWTDRAADYMIDFFGGDADKWTTNYLYGDELTNQAGITNNEDFINLQKKIKEKDEFKASLDNNFFKKVTFNTLASIDATEEHLKSYAQRVQPFTVDPLFQPDGIAEKVAMGFGGMPIQIAEVGALTLAAAGGIALATGTAIGGAPIAAAGIGFGTLGFLASYEEEAGAVLYNTIISAGEGMAFGGLSKLPGWKSRTVAMGGLGAASARLHGGGSEEMIAGAINLASLGFAGRGFDKLTGKNVFGTQPKEPTPKPPEYTFLKAKDVLQHDIRKLDASTKPLRDYIKEDGKGYHVEAQAIPFEISKESSISLLKESKSKKDFELKLGNVEKLELTANTRRDIESGRDTVRFKKITKETKPEELALNEKTIKKDVEIDKQFVIKDGKLIDYTYHLDAATLTIKPKGFTETFKDTGINRTQYNQKDAILDRYNNSKIINGKLKSIDANTIEISFKQLMSIYRQKGAEHKWAKPAFKEASAIKKQEETSMLNRFTKYVEEADINRSHMDRLLNITTRVDPHPGESKIPNANELLYAITEMVKDPKTGKNTFKIKKDKKTGQDKEVDLNKSEAGTGANEIKGLLERQLIPIKLTGDASKNNIKLFVSTKVKQMKGAVDAGINDILYRQRSVLDQPINKFQFIEEKKGFLQEKVFFNFTNAIGQTKTYRSKEGALTEFENLTVKEAYNIPGKMKGVNSQKKIIDAMINREIVMEKKAASAAKNKTPKEIKAEYLKKDNKDNFVYRMSYETLQKNYKLTPEETRIVRKLDEGLTNARILYNKEMQLNPAAGKLIDELPNYYPHAWIGNHRVYIKDPITNDLVGSIVGSSRADVLKQYQTFKQKNPKYDNYPYEYVPQSQSTGKGKENLYEAFYEATRIMDLKDPQLGTALKEAYRDYISRDSFSRVKKERRGVVGNIAGTREGRQGIGDFLEMYTGYISGAVRAKEAGKFQRETAALFDRTDPRADLLMRKFPQQYKISKDYIDMYFGRNDSMVAKSVDSFIKTVGTLPIFNKSPFSFRQFSSTINTVTLHKALLFGNPRYLASAILQPYQMVPQRLAWLKQEYGIKGDVSVALAEGTMLAWKPTKEFKALVTESLKPENAVLDTAFLKEFSTEVFKGKSRQNPYFKPLQDFVVNVTTGKSLAGMAERHSRLQSLGIIYKFLKTANYDKNRSQKDFFDTVMFETQNLMVEYNALNRAQLYTGKGGGSAASAFGLFKTFFHNYLGQMTQYARTWAKSEKEIQSLKKLEELTGIPLPSKKLGKLTDLQAARPALFHVTAGIMTAGLFGAIGVAQADALIMVMNKIFYDTGIKEERIPTLTETILKSNLPNAIKFGIPSDAVGVDISSTMAAPGLGPGDIFSLPALDYLFGFTSKTNPGVINSSIAIARKKQNGTYTPADLYSFLKASLPPTLMAEVERHYAGLPRYKLAEGTFFDRFIPDPSGNAKDTLTDEDSIYYKSVIGLGKDNNKKKWIVANPYKGMRGSIERDVAGFKARYFAGKSFEEALLLKTIWETTKISRRHKDKKDQLVTSIAYILANGYDEEIMPLIDVAKDMGYTYEEIMSKVFTRMEFMNNTVLSRTKGLAKQYNYEQREFILEVLENNSIDLQYMPEQLRGFGK